MNVSKSKYYGTIAVLIALIIVFTIVGYALGGRNTSKGNRLAFQLTKDVAPGHSIEGCYKVVYLDSDVGLAADKVFKSEDDLKDMVAQVQLYENEQITRSNVCKKEDIDRNLEFSMETSTTGTIANGLSVNDKVAILVKFDDERDDAVVVSDIDIKGIKSSSGADITDDTTEPGFLVFRVNEEEAIDLNQASKEGSLYAVRYCDLGKDKLIKNYERPNGTPDDEDDSTDSSDEGQ